jgi:hypothetical protein
MDTRPRTGRDALVTTNVTVHRASCMITKGLGQGVSERELRISATILAMLSVRL